MPTQKIIAADGAPERRVGKHAAKGGDDHPQLPREQGVAVEPLDHDPAVRQPLSGQAVEVAREQVRDAGHPRIDGSAEIASYRLVVARMKLRPSPKTSRTRGS